ncbi:MAG: MarC family protein [Spirosomataceae bacterium]
MIFWVLIPVIVDIHKKSGGINARRATLVSGGLMIAFFVSPVFRNFTPFWRRCVTSLPWRGFNSIFDRVGNSLGRTIFKHDAVHSNATSIVPIAFPIIAGAGTMILPLSRSSSLSRVNIIISILINLVFIYLVLRSAGWLERKLGAAEWIFFASFWYYPHRHCHQIV